MRRIRIVSIETFREYLSEKYPDGEYKIVDGESFLNSKTKIKVLHKNCNQIVRMSSHDFTENHSCPICNKKRMSEIKVNQTGKKKKYRTSEEFRKLAKENNPEFILLNLDSIYNGESIINIKCPKCGTTSSQKVKYVINKKYSCRRCSRKTPLNEYLEKFKNTHPDFYEVDTSEYKEGHITVKCNLCGKTVRRNVHKALAARNICHCENEIRFKEKVNKMYDSQFEYVSGYRTMNSKVKLKHIKCGRTFEIRASHFLYDGCTCTRCKTYKNEEKIKSYLEANNIDYTSQKTFDGCKYKQKLQFDFYIEKYNLLIEYDGEGHFKPIFTDNEEFERVKLRDSIKNTFASSKKINMLRIPYWRKREIEKILSKSFEILNQEKDYEKIQEELNKL